MAAEPDWLRLQKKIFGRYVQQRLREVGNKREITNIVTDLAQDPTLLIEVMQVLSGVQFESKMGKMPPPSTMRIKQIEAADKALKFTLGEGVDLKRIRISPEDLVDGQEKDVLAMVFQIIIRYLKIDADDDDATSQSMDVRQALLLWLKNKTSGLPIGELPIGTPGKGPGFVKSFHNGMVFNALIWKMRPKLVDIEALRPDNAAKNLEQALALGEQCMGVEQYVSVADIAKLDELSMIVYLSDWYHGVSLLQKQDVAARRIAKLADLTLLHDTMKQQYQAKAGALVAWGQGKCAHLAERPFDDTLSGVRALIAAFQEYKRDEKCAQQVELMDCEALFANIALRLSTHKRPPFAPGAGLDPSELRALFATLEKEEASRAAALFNELARQLHLKKVAGRLAALTEKLIAWSVQKHDALGGLGASIDSVEAAEDALDALTLHDAEFEHTSGRGVADCEAFLEELCGERYEHAAASTAQFDAVNQAFGALAAAAATRRGELSAQLSEQKAINEGLFTAFAGAVATFQAWLASKKATLDDASSDLESQLATVQATQAAVGGEAAPLLASLEEHDANLTARALVNNPHTTTTLHDCVTANAQLGMLLGKKAALLREQMAEKDKGGLTDEQVREINDNFDYFDADKSQSLTKRELKTCLQSLGEETTPQAMNSIMAAYDKDKSGCISKEEYLHYMKDHLQDSDTQDEIAAGFRLLAMDADTIRPPQLENVVNDKSFKNAHVAYLLENLAAEGDGLNYSDWVVAAFAR